MIVLKRRDKWCDSATISARQQAKKCIFYDRERSVTRSHVTQIMTSSFTGAIETQPVVFRGQSRFLRRPVDAICRLSWTSAWGLLE